MIASDVTLRFPFPREVRFNRSAHSAAPGLLGCWVGLFFFDLFWAVGGWIVFVVLLVFSVVSVFVGLVAVLLCCCAAVLLG